MHTLTKPRMCEQPGRVHVINSPYAQSEWGIVMTITVQTRWGNATIQTAKSPPCRSKWT